MGVWGMGITQSDEYCEVYERFLEEYDAGKPVACITEDILEEYLAEFDMEDGVLHDVYFALAKGQWMCGGIRPEMMHKVTGIIESGANLDFYQELGSPPADLTLRKRNLHKFLAGLQTPRAKARKRKIPEEKYAAPPKEENRQFPPLPPIRPGDLIAYPRKGKWRMFVVLDIARNRGTGNTAYCFAWAKAFDEIPGETVLRRERGLPLGIVPGDAFPEGYKIVGNMKIPHHLAALIGYNFPMWADYIIKPTQQMRFYKPLPMQMTLHFETVVEKVEFLVRGIR